MGRKGGSGREPWQERIRPAAKLKLTLLGIFALVALVALLISLASDP